MSGSLWLKGAALVVLLCLVFVPATSTAPQEDAAPARPNILFILADDLDVRSAHRMSRLEELLAEQGTTFSQAFVTTSQCCPSRVSTLTGRYAHNHGVETNTPPGGGFAGFHSSGLEDRTVAVELRQSGYRTGFFGKYLNGYCQEERGCAQKEFVPPGWSDWHAWIGAVTMNDDGTLTRFPEDLVHDDVVRRRVVQFVADASEAGQPFFAHVSLKAPHVGTNVAPRHADLFADEMVPRGEAFNEADASDKPPEIQAMHRLTDEEIRDLTAHHRYRLRTLQVADEAVGQFVRELEARGELENTYIFFTSDNGYHLGQHRLRYGKGQAYEEDIRVPLYARGPGVPEGRTLHHKVLNLDFAPTFAELGGARVPAEADGRSFVPLLGGTPPPVGSWRESFLVEFFHHHPYTALRTGRYTYVEHEDGARELYDLTVDPYQLDSLSNSREHQALMEEFHARLKKLEACSGRASCEAAEDGP